MEKQGTIKAILTGIANTAKRVGYRKTTLMLFCSFGGTSIKEDLQLLREGIRQYLVMRRPKAQNALQVLLFPFLLLIEIVLMVVEYTVVLTVALIGNLYYWSLDLQVGFIDLVLPPKGIEFSRFDRGGAYHPETQMGYVLLMWAENMKSPTWWYSSYVHESLHFLLHKLEGMEACTALDNLDKLLRQEDLSLYYLWHDLYIGIGSSATWLPDLNPYIRETPELRRKWNLQLWYYGPIIGGRE